MTLPVINPNASLPELTRIVAQMAIQINQMQERTKPNVEGWAGNQTNVTADRAYDANASTTAELADVLGTLISDLINVGIIK